MRFPEKGEKPGKEIKSAIGRLEKREEFVSAKTGRTLFSF
jgi:hypothetical protein